MMGSEEKWTQTAHSFRGDRMHTSVCRSGLWTDGEGDDNDDDMMMR